MTESITESAGPPATTAATKRWFYRKFTSTGEVIDFLNGHPAQGPGEFNATTHSDGTVDLF